MKEQQLSMYDCLTTTPEVWDCRKTCKRFGEKVDYPSWWFGEARCLLPKNGDWEQFVFDNTVHFTCKLYESR